VTATPTTEVALSRVDVTTSRERVALSQQLSDVVTNLAGGVDRIQQQLDSLYAGLSRAAAERAPIDQIVETTQALTATKAQVGEGSPLYQQAMLLKQVGEAYMELLRTL
ncbi:MAG: hypothetical protein KGR26_16325, partial [Cyanobacteria bacterium REEB65]|nr:hypothetical protein [Cyanobacteria bacterium REEB65]